MNLVLGMLMMAASVGPVEPEMRVATLSPDQKLLAVGDTRGSIYLIDLPQGTIRNRIILKHPFPIDWVSFSPSGRYLCASAFWSILVPEDNISGEMVVFDLKASKEKSRFMTENSIRGCDFLPGEDGLAVIGEEELYTVTLDCKVQDKIKHKLQLAIDFLVVEGKQPVVRFADDRDLTIWEPKKKSVETIPISFPDKRLLMIDLRLNRILYYEHDRKLASCRLPLNRKEKAIFTQIDWDDRYFAWPKAQMSKDGKNLYVAVSGKDGESPKVVQWNCANKKCVGEFRRNDKLHITLFVVSDNLIILTSANKKIEFWNKTTGELQKIVDLDDFEGKKL